MQQERKRRKTRRFGGSGENSVADDLASGVEVVDISTALQAIDEALHTSGENQANREASAKMQERIEEQRRLREIAKRNEENERVRQLAQTQQQTKTTRRCGCF